MRTLIDRISFAVLGLLLFVAPALSDGPQGMVVLTVGGAVANSNIDAVKEGDQTLLGFHGIAFDKATAFDSAALAEMKQVRYRAAVPGADRQAEFSGPLLLEVLKAAGALGDTVTLTAMDGYAVELSLAYLKEHRPILATTADGRPLAIGGLGPAMAVFPPTDDPDLAAEHKAMQVWSLFFIDVE